MTDIKESREEIRKKNLSIADKAQTELLNRMDDEEALKKMSVNQLASIAGTAIDKESQFQKSEDDAFKNSFGTEGMMDALASLIIKQLRNPGEMLAIEDKTIDVEVENGEA